jgi:hypothetical protein
VQKGITPEKQLQADQEYSLLDQTEHVATSAERDELYFRLALLALGRDDMKARDYVDKIEESGFRKHVQAWVDAGLAGNSLRNKKIETVLELARNGELTHIQRLWLLTQTAKLLAKTNHDKAFSLLDDATAEARRIEISDLDHPRGLLAIANALKLVEPSRAWEAAFDAVKAANSTDGFTGEGGALTFHVNSKSQGVGRTENIPDFDIQGIFSRLALDDYDRAAQLAHGFQGDAPRTNATLAVALAILNQKNASAPASRPAAKP